MCTQAGRLDEALDLVKRLARQHGAMQQATLNSLTRALSASHVDRALRLLSLMNTLGLRATRCCLCCPSQVRLRVARLAQAVCQVSFVPILCTALPFKPWNGRIDPIFSATLGIVQAQRGSPVAAMCRETCVTLIRACAKASRSDVAEAMYWDLRRQKLEVTRSAGVGTHRVAVRGGCHSPRADRVRRHDAGCRRRQVIIASARLHESLTTALFTALLIAKLRLSPELLQCLITALYKVINMGVLNVLITLPLAHPHVFLYLSGSILVWPCITRRPAARKTQARDAQRRALVSAVMPDADALAALATAYARHARLPQALQFYAQIKRSFRFVLLTCLPPALSVEQS